MLQQCALIARERRQQLNTALRRPRPLSGVTTATLGCPDTGVDDARKLTLQPKTKSKKRCTKEGERKHLICTLYWGTTACLFWNELECFELRQPV